MRNLVLCGAAIFLLACSPGCSRASLPDYEHGLDGIGELDGTAPEGEVDDRHGPLRTDPTLELRLSVEPESPEDGQVVALALFVSQTRRESPGVYPDGSPAEVHRQITGAEQAFLVDAMHGLSFFERATSTHSARVEAPTTAPPGEQEYEPAVDGVLRMVLTTHDDDWYHYRALVIDDREEAAAFVSALIDGVEHETAANLFGLVDLLVDPF